MGGDIKIGVHRGKNEIWNMKDLENGKEQYLRKIQMGRHK